MDPQLYQKNELYYLKFDFADHYYEGQIVPGLFPPSIIDYISCVKKAIQGIITPIQSINGKFNKGANLPLPAVPAPILNSTYDITIKFINDFMNSETLIQIPLMYHKKEQIDYINEQFVDIKKKLADYENENRDLKNSIEKLLKRVKELESYIGDDSDKDSEPKDDKTKEDKIKKSENV